MIQSALEGMDVGNVWWGMYDEKYSRPFGEN